MYAEAVASKAGDQVQSTPPAVEQLSGRVQMAERERDEALTNRDAVVNQIARNDLLYVTGGFMAWMGEVVGSPIKNSEKF